MSDDYHYQFGRVNIISHEGGREIVAFVILHYMSADLTCECIESVLNLESNYNLLTHCVVIDNGSNNGSFEKLQYIWSGHESVTLISANHNVGFSRANNVAYSYAVENLSPKYIAIVNNDVVIEQSDFLDVLESVYITDNQVYVIGPDIFVKKNDLHQSPVDNLIPTEDSVVASIRSLEKRESQCSKQRIMGVLMHCKTIRNYIRDKTIKKLQSFNGWQCEYENCVIHGAALIFTPRFIKTHEKPFEPETFLYQEENILAVRCLRHGWKVVYTPRLQVIHHDDGATDIVYSDWKQKQKFLNTNVLISSRQLLEYIKSDK